MAFVKQPSERAFGLTVGLVCAMLALRTGWRHGPTVPAQVLGGIASGLLLSAWFRPSLLRSLNRWWMRLARLLGWINNRLILGAVFLALMTPLGLMFRLAGRDFLRLRRPRGASGWVPYPARYQDPKHYERMY